MRQCRSLPFGVRIALAVPGDDPQQKLAIETLRAPESVAISVHVLCELA